SAMSRQAIGARRSAALSRSRSSRAAAPGSARRSVCPYPAHRSPAPSPSRSSTIRKGPASMASPPRRKGALTHLAPGTDRRGALARETLMKGCSLDLHPRSFTPGQCAQTMLARAQIILHQIDGAPSYDLYPRRSFAEYLWLWLCDAMAEYGEATPI